MKNYLDRPFVANVLNPDGTIHDRCWNWETAQNFALNGWNVEAIADDGHMSKEDIQNLCDAELERYNDCFGVNDHRFNPAPFCSKCGGPCEMEKD